MASHLTTTHEADEFSFEDGFLVIGGIRICPIMVLRLFMFLQEHEQELNKMVDAAFTQHYDPHRTRPVLAMTA